MRVMAIIRAELRTFSRWVPMKRNATDRRKNLIPSSWCTVTPSTFAYLLRFFVLFAWIIMNLRVDCTLMILYYAEFLEMIRKLLRNTDSQDNRIIALG